MKKLNLGKEVDRLTFTWDCVRMNNRSVYLVSDEPCPSVHSKLFGGGDDPGSKTKNVRIFEENDPANFAMTVLEETIRSCNIKISKNSEDPEPSSQISPIVLDDAVLEVNLENLESNLVDLISWHSEVSFNSNVDDVFQ